MHQGTERRPDKTTEGGIDIKFFDILGLVVNIIKRFRLDQTHFFLETRCFTLIQDVNYFPCPSETKNQRKNVYEARFPTTILFFQTKQYSLWGRGSEVWCRVDLPFVAPQSFLKTKPLVLKPAPGRVSWNTVPFATPTSSFDTSRLQPTKNMKTCFLRASILLSRSHETFVKQNRWF